MVCLAAVLSSDLSDDDQMNEGNLMGKDTYKEKNISESESDQEVNQEFQSKVSTKRNTSAGPQLTDHKIKHLERNLSTA